jgi:hypothetical protein
MILIVACIKPVVPRRTKVTPNDIKKAVHEAQDVCTESKKTPMCRIMWDRVDELSHALARQEELKAEQEPDLWDELETREYDV